MHFCVCVYVNDTHTHTHSRSGRGASNWHSTNKLPKRHGHIGLISAILERELGSFLSGCSCSHGPLCVCVHTLCALSLSVQHQIVIQTAADLTYCLFLLFIYRGLLLHSNQPTHIVALILGIVSVIFICFICIVMEAHVQMLRHEVDS